MLDDGFQHLRLARDLDLLCLAPHGPGRSAPARGSVARVATPRPRGPMRFSCGTARCRPGCRLDRAFLARRRPEDSSIARGRPVEAPRRPFLVAGIAHPERFAADVRGLGAATVGEAFFPDHHRFSEADLASTLRAAAAAGADALVTTEKDLPRLPDVTAPAGPRAAHQVDIEGGRPLRERVLAVARRAEARG